MRIKQLEVITCPKCGYEYLPAEIFIPKAFFGKPENIKRDEKGKIVGFSKSSVDNHEVYTCDKCDTTFRITARLTFLTDIKDSLNFNEDYSDSLEKQELFTMEE